MEAMQNKVGGGEGLPGLSRWVTLPAPAQVHQLGSAVNLILLVFYWGFIETYLDKVD